MPTPIPTHAPTPTPTIAAVPTSTLQLFCELVSSNGSQLAYDNLYTDRLKQIAFQQFQDDWTGQPFKNNINTCTSSPTFTYPSSTQAQGTLVVQKHDGPGTQAYQLTYNVTLVKTKN